MLVGQCWLIACAPELVQLAAIRCKPQRNSIRRRADSDLALLIMQTSTRGCPFVSLVELRVSGTSMTSLVAPRIHKQATNHITAPKCQLTADGD
jgi:hypothetical protein